VNSATISGKNPGRRADQKKKEKEESLSPNNTPDQYKSCGFCRQGMVVDRRIASHRSESEFARVAENAGSVDPR